MEKRRVVITGMGAITPLGNSVEETWAGIKAGKSGIGPITYFDSSINKVHYAAEVKNFNAGDYMDSKEARKMARFTQFGVAAAKQCLEDSGLMGNEEVLNETGIVLGVGIGGLEVTESSILGMQKLGFVKTNPMAIPMLIPNEVGGNIAISFGLHGPVQSVSTACSSGTDAMGVALEMVRSGRLDCCLTGGAEATICQYGIVAFEVLHALSTGFDDDPTKASRPFDKKRNGFVMGEGAGMLVLEEYEHAKARGAKIYAEIAGYGNACDAYHVTAPEPQGAGLARAIKLAFEEANVADDAQIYINAHGTSTHLNDLTETMAIKTALGEKAYDANISSTKSMTGHMLGAAGAVEAIAAILSIKDGIVPPTIHLNEVDEELDLNYTPNKAVKRDINVAASTNLGFGGHDACVVFKKI